MKAYFETLNEDLKKNINEGPVFYRGYPPSKGKASKFSNEVMGKVTLSNCGKEVARFLKLENPDKYTGHCFRYVLFSLANKTL